MLWSTERLVAAKVTQGIWLLNQVLVVLQASTTGRLESLHTDPSHTVGAEKAVDRNVVANGAKLSFRSFSQFLLGNVVNTYRGVRSVKFHLVVRFICASV